MVDVGRRLSVRSVCSAFVALAFFVEWALYAVGVGWHTIPVPGSNVPPILFLVVYVAQLRFGIVIAGPDGVEQQDVLKPMFQSGSTCATPPSFAATCQNRIG